MKKSPAPLRVLVHLVFISTASSTSILNTESPNSWIGFADQREH